MTARIWTKRQCGNLSGWQKKEGIPHDVIENIHKVIDILDRHYGEDRQVDEDDGGYLFLSTDFLEEGNSIKELLGNYHVRAEDTELEDVLCSCGSLTWKSVLYLVTSDYGITLIYPCRKEGK